MNKDKEHRMLFEAGEADGYKKRQKRVPPPSSLLKSLLFGSKYLNLRTKIYNQGYFAGRQKLEQEKIAAKQLKQNDATKDMVFRIHYQKAYGMTLVGKSVVVPQHSEYKLPELKVKHIEGLQKGIRQAKIDRERIMGINNQNEQKINR